MIMPAGLTGIGKELYKWRRSFALELRDTVDFVAIREHLVQIALGRNPATGEAADVATQIKAAQVLIQYAHGMPVQSVVLEGTIRNEHALANPKPARPPMTLEQITARREQLRALGVKPRIIDAESVEAPSLTLPAPPKDDDATDDE